MALDRNGDGKLDKEEIPESMQGLLRRIDVSRDGFIDQAELAAFVNNPNTNTFGGLGEPAYGGGIFLVGSNPGTPAAALGLEYGDVIVSINGVAVNTQAEYVNAVHASPDEMKLVVRDCRTAQFLEMTVRLAR
jgi:S1-C subfamily serine protease